MPDGKTTRFFCKTCHVGIYHDAGFIQGSTPSMLRTFPFKAVVHVNYGETVLHVKDGLPKFKDFPKESGGSGEMVAE